MIRAQHTVEISRPVEEVFAFVCDQTNEPRWHTDVLDAEPKEPLKLGKRVTWHINYMGQNQYVCEVTRFEPNRQSELTTLQGPLKPTLTETFEPVNRTRRFTRLIEIPLQGMIRLVGPIMKLTGAARRKPEATTRPITEAFRTAVMPTSSTISPPFADRVGGRHRPKPPPCSGMPRTGGKPSHEC